MEREVDEELVERFGLVVGRLSRKLNQRAKGELTLSQWSALALTARCGPVRLGALAAQEEVSPPVLSRLVGGLETAGLVERKPDPADARASLLTATQLGTRRLADMRATYTSVLECLLAELSGGQRDALAAAMPVLEELVDRLAKQSGPAMSGPPK